MGRRKKIKRGRNRDRETLGELTPPRRVRRFKYYFLIVCEDAKTEPTYFEQFKATFPDKTLYLECVGTGRDPLGVVEQAVKERKLLQERARKEIDRTWVVFDKDDADLNAARISRFEQAFTLAESQIVNTAFSNEVFELWLLLHLTDVDGEKPIPRAEIYKRLESAVRRHQSGAGKAEDFNYVHGKVDILAEVAEYGSETEAIKRAQHLRKALGKRPPIMRNPSTEMDLLVAELRSWIAFYTPE